MRCYFMKEGHICGVEFLTETSDETRIARATEIFAEKGKSHAADGFEVWDGHRFVYRFPPDPEPAR